MEPLANVLPALERDGLAILLFACNGARLVEANGVLPRLSGYPGNTLRERGLACLADATTDHAIQSALAAAIAAGSEMRGEISWARHDGSSFWFGFSVVPVEDVGGYGRAVVLMGRDITERRRIAQNEAMTQTVLASVFRLLDMPAAVVRSDARILFANPALAELTHYALREFPDLNFDHLTAAGSLEEAQSRRSTQRQGDDPYRMRLVLRRKDGVEVPVRLTSAMIDHQSAIGFRVLTMLPEATAAVHLPIPHESVVGRVRLVRLEALQQAYGARWNEVAPRLMMLCEAVIKRRLEREDVYARTEDGSFAIWFARGNEVENAERIAAITREIRIRLVGEVQGDAVPDVVGLVAMVPSHDLSRPPGEKELAATLMDRLEARRDALRNTVLAELKDALAVPATVMEKLPPASGNVVGLVWVDLAGELRRVIESARALSKAGDDPLPGDEIILAGAVAEHILVALANGDRSLHAFPVAFGAIASTARRRGFTALCRGLPPSVRETMLPVIDSLPSGIVPQRILELGMELAPIIGSVGLASDSAALPPMPPGLIPFSLVVFEAAALSDLPDERIARVFAEARSRRLKVAVRAVGKGDHDRTRLARLGVQFVGVASA